MINHTADESSPAITSSYAVTQIQQQSTVTTVTTTVLVSATTRDIVQPASTVTSYVTLSTATPQSSCSCSGQQQTSASSSSSDSDVVTIVIPVVVVFGLIILVVVIVIGILIWRKVKDRGDTPYYTKAIPKTKVLVENDLYGLVVMSITISCFSLVMLFLLLCGMKTLWQLNFTVHLSIVWVKSCWDFNITEAKFCTRSCSDIY